MAMTKLWKFWTNIQELNWGQSVEVTKTGAEAAKAVLDLAKAIEEQQPNVKNFKPYVEQISSLLDVFNSPLGQITKEVIPFAPIAITILKFIIDATHKEPSLESCVILVSQAAYIDSFQDILKQDAALLQKIDSNLPASHTLALQIQKLGEQEFEQREVKKAILYFHESQLAESFNQILQQRLQEAGLTETEAKTLTERVARHTDDNMQDALVEVGEKADKLWKWYSAGGKEKLEKNLNIEDYLEQVIKPKPEETIFEESDITFRDLYVPLQVKELDTKDDANLEIEEWVKAILNDSDSKHKQVLFIQGEAGRGKSVFCRMFADWVQRELHPSFTPILIRLRDLRVLKDNLTDTLENYLQHVDFVTSDSGWLTDKNTRFLFLLDGFDELLLEGRASGGLKEFLEQVEQFQKDRLCHHQFLVTGRPLALQGNERFLSQTKSLKRVELQPMDDSLRQTWLKKWAIAAQVNKNEFEEFLQACPDEVKNKLAREPLLLYLLAQMHRDKRLNSEMFAGADAIKAKIRIYDESVKWVLEKQRDSKNQNDNYRLTGLESDDLRQFLTEAALCVVQSGNESARVAMLETRLKDSNNPAAKLIQQARQGNDSEKNQQDKLLNNLLTAFYIKPASGDKGGSVEFVHKSFSEFLFAERLLESFVDWTTKIPKRKREEDSVTTSEMDKQIYDLFGYGNLTREIVEYLMGLLAESSEFQDVERLCQLFQRLEYFYLCWCDGEFIDAEDVNLPQMKKKQLREQLPERENHLGLRQVDVCTGLNVMIVLLELHRYAKTKDDLKDKISFHPCGKLDSDQFDSQRLLRIIGYSHCLGVFAFNDNLGLFLSGADLRDTYLGDTHLRRADLRWADLRRANLRDTYLGSANLSNADLSDADLSDANLIGANLNNANLNDADLSNANLIGANLSDANLSNANLNGANLSDANLSDANLNDANLSGANLSGANLNDANLNDADLSNADLKAVVWNSDTKWLNAKGLHEAVAVSPELAQDSAFAAAASLSQGISWVEEGKIKEAQEAFKQAQIFDPSLINSAEFCNSICLVGCLHGYAKNVLPICEKAVTLDPDNKNYQDSRGLARVLTGDLVGALEDFQAAVNSGAIDYSEDVKQRRLRWIEALKSGNNPLTPEELEELRQVEG
ncbi:pentapeptide repeat-containing protein [Nostocaceae cyanobacterium CENA357]|uniref:Pentapeptide repeat-containing protein n=1 Tax=Atlanticothrix silvestris CENA357 TaxID=1725252 RepID=A0A8J7H6P8_9CYAN|nr:pentapeptide repeat-containing protein [Atlanticothrix silvestris]MBH8551322.1 pentapeptide repeat-containing protein [Atlanticothrix silvestris CENA357]